MPVTVELRLEPGFPTPAQGSSLSSPVSLRPVDSPVPASGGQGSGQREAGPVPDGQVPLPKVASGSQLLSWLAFLSLGLAGP